MEDDVDIVMLVRKWWWIIPGIVVIYIGIYNIVFQIKYGGMPIAAMTRGFALDCLWTTIVIAWIDTNQNGIQEEKEPPLPGFTFHVSKGADAITNWKGETALHVWLPGCPDATFDFYPEVPDGYRLTTESGFSSNVRNYDQVYRFGFAYLPGVPTATPRPAPPVCESFPIGKINVYDVTDIAIASDQTIWVATFGNGVA